jgi:hypothetical protein
LRGLFEMLETYSNLDNQADIQSLLHIECWHCISNFRQVFTSGQTLHNWRNKWCAVITIDYIYTSSLFNMQMNSYTRIQNPRYIDIVIDGATTCTLETLTSYIY